MGFQGYPPEQPSGCRGCQGVSPTRGFDPKGVEEACGLHVTEFHRGSASFRRMDR